MEEVRGGLRSILLFEHRFFKGIIRRIWTQFCFMSISDLLDVREPLRAFHFESSAGTYKWQVKRSMYAIV